MNIVEIMLSAVRTQVCGEPSVSFGELSEEQLKALYSLSKAQDLAHIVATELDSQGLLSDDIDVCNKFRKQQFIAIMRYERINYELEEICRLLEKQGIPHMPLKGSVIRKYYPQPWMRTSADIDLLVHKEDVDRASRALEEELNYQNEGAKTEYDISLFAPSGVHLELHYSTASEDRVFSADKILASIWEFSHLVDGWNFRFENNDEMFFFYHVVHTLKHFECSGCGARPFLDLWLLCHRCEFDREKREQLLDEGGILPFAKAAERLAEAWLSGESHDELTRQMEQYILGGSIYGSQEQRIMTSQIKRGGKVGYAMSRIFLPYQNMERAFPSLKRRKILLPFYHVYRWLRIIFTGGTKRSINELKMNAKLADTKTDDVECMFKQLGLSNSK